VSAMDLNDAAGILRIATFGRGVFELAPPSGPAIAVNAENGLDFGQVCPGDPAFLTIQIFNVGNAPLVIDSVHRIFGDASFTVLPIPATPVTIAPSAEIGFTVRFTPPASPGLYSAQIRIVSDDPGAQTLDLMATAIVSSPDIRVTGSAAFGDVCAGISADKTVTVCDLGRCDLHVTTAAFTPAFAAFPLVNNPFPATVSHDSCN